MLLLDQIAEQRIREAMERGEREEYRARVAARLARG